jgi:hypothetical protein
MAENAGVTLAGKVEKIIEASRGEPGRAGEGSGLS